MKKRRKTGFESFAQTFLIITTVIFVFGIIMVKSVESSYNRTIQKLQNDMKKIQEARNCFKECADRDYNMM